MKEMITIKLLLIVCSLLALLPLSWSQYFPVTTNPCKCSNSGGSGAGFPEFVFTNGVICNWDIFLEVKDIYYTGESLMYITMPFGSCWNVTSGSLNCLCQHQYGFDPWDARPYVIHFSHWYDTYRLPEAVTFNYDSWLVIEWPKVSRCQTDVGGPDHPGKTDDGHFYAFEINEVYPEGAGYVPNRRWCAVEDGLKPWTPGVPYPYEVRDLPVGEDPYYDGWGRPWNESIYAPGYGPYGPEGLVARSATVNEAEDPPSAQPNATALFLQKLQERQSISDEEYSATEARKAFEALDSDHPYINKTFVQLMIDRKNLTRPCNSTDDPLP